MLPSGISQSFAYDNIGRLVDSKTRQSSKVRRECKYHWGEADRLLKTEDSRYGTTTYEYSATGYLQKATYVDGRKEYSLQTRWATSLMTPNASCASTSKGIRSSSRASDTSSMTRMGSLPRSTKARASGGTRSVNAGGMSGIRTGRLRLSSRPIGRTG